MLPAKVYSAFEKAISPQNISQEPAILDTYAFQWAAEVLNVIKDKPPSRYYLRPAAVILPGSVEEVQNVVKLCNKYRTTYPAYISMFKPYNNKPRLHLIKCFTSGVNLCLLNSFIFPGSFRANGRIRP